MKQLLTLVLLISVCLSGFSSEQKVTASELAALMNIHVFMIELPNDLKASDKLVLEVVSKDGVVDSKLIPYDFVGKTELKVFMNNSDSNKPIFSLLPDPNSRIGLHPNLGKARINLWINQQTYKVGDFFVFGGDKHSPVAGQQTPIKDNIALRFKVKK